MCPVARIEEFCKGLGHCRFDDNFIRFCFAKIDDVLEEACGWLAKLPSK